jgi:hypothetical protein
MAHALLPLATGAFGSYLSTRLQHQYSRETEDKAWHRETEYNHPSSQIARLKAAGLNPALMYSAGSASAAGNTHASMVSPQVNDLSPHFSQYYTHSLAAAQIEKSKAEADIVRHDANILKDRKLSLSTEKPSFLERVGSKAYGMATEGHSSKYPNVDVEFPTLNEDGEKKWYGWYDRARELLRNTLRTTPLY